MTALIRHNLLLIILLANIPLWGGEPDLTGWLSGTSENPLPDYAKKISALAAAPATLFTNYEESPRVRIENRLLVNQDIFCPLFSASLNVSGNLVTGLQFGGGRWNDDNLQLFSPFFATLLGNGENPWIGLLTYTHFTGPDDFHGQAGTIGLQKIFYIKNIFISAGIDRTSVQWRVHADDPADVIADSHFSRIDKVAALNISAARKVGQRLIAGITARFASGWPHAGISLQWEI